MYPKIVMPGIVVINSSATSHVLSSVLVCSPKLTRCHLGKVIVLIEPNLEELGIDVERTRTPKKRHLRIYENRESPYHPLQQNPPDLVDVTGDG